MRHGRPSGQALSLDYRGECSATTLDHDERSGVEHPWHSGGDLICGTTPMIAKVPPCGSVMMAIRSQLKFRQLLRQERLEAFTQDFPPEACTADPTIRRPSPAQGLAAGLVAERML